MKYSQATNYALHSMLYLAASDAGQAVGVQQLAEQLGVSPTYLSKILTKLVKAGLVESASGMNGGYRLRGHKESISLLTIIQAIEGSASLFNCSLQPDDHTCLVQDAMTAAEQKMEQHLQETKLADLVAKMDHQRLHVHQ